jgi:hypothetical protein
MTAPQKEYLIVLHEDTEEQFTAKCLQELAAIKRAEQTGPTRDGPPPCLAPCVPISCDDCPCDPDRPHQHSTAYLEYLQEKSNQNEPVRVPQYERD